MSRTKRKSGQKRSLQSSQRRLPQQGRKRQLQNRRRKRPQRVFTRPIFAPASYGIGIKNSGMMNQLTLTHREYVTDLAVDSTGSSETILSREINPGLRGAFPWLSTVSNSFETYTFNSLSFVFVPLLPTSTAGSVALCPDYDATDNDLEHTKVELLSFRDCSRASIWTTNTCKCSATNLKKVKQQFVRFGSIPDAADLKFYDVCQLTAIITSSLAADTIVGELWVDYCVTLYTPQLNHEAAIESLSGMRTVTAPAETMFKPASSEISLLGNMITDGVVSLATGDNATFDIWRPGIYTLAILADSLTEAQSLVLNSDGPSSMAEIEQVSAETDYMGLWELVVNNSASYRNRATVEVFESSSAAADYIWAIVDTIGGLAFTATRGRKYVYRPSRILSMIHNKRTKILKAKKRQLKMKEEKDPPPQNSQECESPDISKIRDMLLKMKEKKASSLT